MKRLILCFASFYFFFGHLSYGQGQIQIKTDTLYSDSIYCVNKQTLVREVNHESYTSIDEIKWYSKNGHLISSYNQINGLTQGKVESFYSKGLIKEIYWCTNDIRVGVYISFYSNGNLKAIGNYEPFDDNIKPQYENDSIIGVDDFGGEYLNIIRTLISRKTGLWRFYSIDGGVESIEDFSQ
jgi:antitoxin component YwqK of YwqJK toxin-antitoxin module